MREMNLSCLPSNLRRLRAELGWNQAELARRVNLVAAAGVAPFSQQYISDLERGLRPRADGDLVALAAAFRVSVPRLLKRLPPLVRAMVA